MSKASKYKSSNPYLKYLTNHIFITSKDSDFYYCHDQHLGWAYFSQDSSKRNQDCGCTEVCIYHAEGKKKEYIQEWCTPNIKLSWDESQHHFIQRARAPPHRSPSDVLPRYTFTHSHFLTLPLAICHTFWLLQHFPLFWPTCSWSHLGFSLFLLIDKWITFYSVDISKCKYRHVQKKLVEDFCSL